MSRLIDADELLKQAYKSGDWDRGEHPMVVDAEDIENAPTINEYHFIMKGYEQGFNDRRQEAIRAERWHYPSKGEYPTEGEQVWVAWTSEGSYDVVEFRYDRWGMKLSPPYAWQHIVPPKEEA